MKPGKTKSPPQRQQRVRPVATAPAVTMPPSDLAILREKTEAQVAALVTPVLTKLGYELVRVQLAGARDGLTLQLMAERMDGKAMLVEDCRAITQGVDLLLDEADPIPGAYALEVSSPGIDRPLTREKDFTNWAGFAAKLTLNEPMNGRKNFNGTLQGLRDGAVLLEVEKTMLALPYAAIAKAQLVLTDELIAATAAREAAAGQTEESVPLANVKAPQRKK